MTKASKPNTENRPARQAHLQWVPADDLRVNPVAQREFRPNHARDLLHKFDIDKFQVPHVNRRADGSLYIMEGQHSTWAYRHFFGDGQQIQVWLYEGLSEREEAEFFLSLNDRKNIDPMDRFKAGVTAEREAESDIDRIVRANGCTVSKSRADHSIGAIGALNTIYQRHGGAVLGRTLRVIRDSFGEGGYERPVMLGIAAVLARYSDQIDDQRLTTKLGSIRNGWKGLVQRTAQIRQSHGVSQAEAASAAVVEIYNSGRGGVKLMTWWAA